MDRKQQPEMWFVFLVSFSLCITAQTECSVEWLGLKIKVFTKMLEGIWDWFCEHTLCPAPGAFSWWLWPAESLVRVAAKPEHPVMLTVSLIMSLMPKGQQRRMESTTWTGQDEGREHLRGRGGDAGDGQALALLGWLKQPRLVSDMHMHMQSLHLQNRDFKHRNQQSKCLN